MSTERREGVVADQKGAILVMAVFMSVFLVGCLWYLVGIGDAAIYRQKMQDGSDAVAYASAVYHARGMNIIAIMNLLMAAILAVLIALKIAEIIAWTVAAVTTILCPFTGAACPFIAPSTYVGEQLSYNIIPKYEQWSDKLLKALSQGEAWVARLTPWIGATRGAMATTNYNPTVTSGLAMSLSMIPDDTRLGLPVEEEPFDKLCKRAGTMVGNLVFGWLPGGWGKFAGSVLGSVVGSFPSFFCNGSGSNGAGAGSGTNNSAKSQCDDAKKEYDQQHPNGPAFELKKCQDAVEKADPQKQLGGKGGGQYDGNGKTSKAVYYKAYNGNEYFQVYSFVLGDNDSMRKRSQKTVEMPAWGKAKVDPNVIASQLERVGFSQAEFFYDQVDPSKLQWADYSEDAMYNMRWRARLRRFRMPSNGLAGGLFQNGIPDWVPGIPSQYKNLGLNWIGQTVGASVGDNWMGTFIKGQLGGAIPSQVNQFVGGVTDPTVIH